MIFAFTVKEQVGFDSGTILKRRITADKRLYDVSIKSILPAYEEHHQFMPKSRTDGYGSSALDKVIEGKRWNLLSKKEFTIKIGENMSLAQEWKKLKPASRD